MQIKLAHVVVSLMDSESKQKLERWSMSIFEAILVLISENLLYTSIRIIGGVRTHCSDETSGSTVTGGASTHGSVINGAIIPGRLCG